MLIMVDMQLFCSDAGRRKDAATANDKQQTNGFNV